MNQQTQTCKGCLGWIKDMLTNPKSLLLLILVILLIILLIIIIIRMVAMSGQQINLAPQPMSARQPQSLENLPRTLDGVQGTYSMWVYIDNWDYKYSDVKPIFAHGSFVSASFGKGKNNIVIQVSTSKGQEPLITLRNIKIQKWANITIVYNNRTLNVYKDGELTVSRKLLGVPEPDDNKILVTPSGGFSGKVCNFQYYNRALSNRQIVKKIYNKGKACSPKGLFGTNWLWWFYININIGDPSV